MYTPTKPRLTLGDFDNQDLGAIWNVLLYIANNTGNMDTVETIGASGGGQTGATQSSKDDVLINLVNVNDDGIRARKMTAGVRQKIQNRAGNGNNCKVYPYVGDNLGAGIDQPVDLADGNDLGIVCYNDGVGTL